MTIALSTLQEYKPKVYLNEPEFCVIDWSPHLRRKRPWKKRKGKINKLVVHHTAGNCKPFPLGLDRSADYCIDYKGWPTVPYHYYAPWEKVEADDGRPCIFLINAPSRHTYHTLGANTSGLGIVFQGKFDYDKDGEHPSEWQQEYAVEIVASLALHHGISSENIKGHYSYTKAACPGYWLEGMCEAFQGGYGYMYGPGVKTLS